MSDATKDRTDYLYSKTVKGHPYLYFRHVKLAKPVRLPLDQGSAEFRRCYDACLKAVQAQTAPSPPVKHHAPVIIKNVAFIGDTFGKAVEVYRRSPEWANLRDTTRRDYVKKLDIMCEILGDTRLSSFDIDAVNRYSALVAIPGWVTREVCGTMKKIRRGGPVAADTHVALISNIWQVCQQHPEFGIRNIPNPARDAIQRCIKTKNPARPWTEEQQDKFIDTAPAHLTLGYLMLKYFGQRGGDCIKIRWSDFTRKQVDGRWAEGLMVAPEKGDDREPVFSELPRRLLDAIKAKQKLRRHDGDETILTNVWDKPFASSSTLSAAIRNHLIEIGLAKRFTKTISMHGLRKNAAQIAARTLLGTDGVMAMTGHKDPEMAKYYAEQAAREAMRSKVVERIDAMEAEKAAARVRSKRATIRRVK